MILDLQLPPPAPPCIGGETNERSRFYVSMSRILPLCKGELEGVVNTFSVITSMKQATIQLRNLAIGYKGKNDTKVVASDICTAINGGELTCLLGANGVGKSTLLRTLSAFQPKLEGEIDIMGREIGT